MLSRVRESTYLLLSKRDRKRRSNYLGWSFIEGTIKVREGNKLLLFFQGLNGGVL